MFIFKERLKRSVKDILASGVKKDLKTKDIAENRYLPWYFYSMKLKLYLLSAIKQNGKIGINYSFYGSSPKGN